MTGIHTLLIANRGEIARRIIRTAREMGIRTVAVYADADRTAPHVREADVAVPLRGDTVADTYLDVTQLLDAAAWQGADAVHPGYGFLAERAPFARAVVDAGLQWVGPPPEAITTLGDKLRARAVAATIDIPVLPGAVLGTDHVDAWHSLADEIGFPLMVKAAAGGGGRGMRVVDDAGALADAVAAAGREALAAFGDATVYLERLVRAPRHVEVQIVADRHGTVLHLGERECSIQRRHQKLIEEAPSPSLDDATRADIAAAAVRLAAEVGYESLGTVEVLVDDRSAEPTWWFLEMNTRIQVEHPVTEAVYGVDLVRLQLEVAGGQALRLRQEDLVPHGHAIEARVCAEDPLADWAPSAGPVHRFAPGPTPGLRYDAAVASGAVVAPDYDSLLVKVIAHADDRVEATRRLVRGLRELVLHGPATNRAWLVERALLRGVRRGGDAHGLRGPPPGRSRRRRRLRPRTSPPAAQHRRGTAPGGGGARRSGRAPCRQSVGVRAVELAQRRRCRAFQRAGGPRLAPARSAARCGGAIRDVPRRGRAVAAHLHPGRRRPSAGAQATRRRVRRADEPVRGGDQRPRRHVRHPGRARTPRCRPDHPRPVHLDGPRRPAGPTGRGVPLRRHVVRELGARRDVCARAGTLRTARR
ncbi:MAG: biotin carboxylase N-terminal domain-containing protein [Acidimicrobiales bacterium]